MVQGRRTIVTAVLAGIVVASWTLVAGQLQLSPVRDRGQTITPQSSSINARSAISRT